MPPTKNYKITLATVASMDDATYDFYKNNIADLHEALCGIEDETVAPLTMVETDESAVIDWSNSTGDNSADIIL